MVLGHFAAGMANERKSEGAKAALQGAANSKVVTAVGKTGGVTKAAAESAAAGGWTGWAMDGASGAMSAVSRCVLDK